MKYLLLTCLLLVGAPAQAEWIGQQADMMGTRVNVTLWHEDVGAGEALAARALDEMRRIDALYSPYREDSDLSRLNRRAGAGQTVQISAEMATLLDKALYYGELTDGAFDITFASVARYYDYRQGKAPSDKQREQLLPAIDYRHVQLDGQQVRYGHPAVYIDLGGIAKGYAVDRALALLREGGVAHASVSAGGDSAVLGDRRGRPWMVGIKQPRGEGGVAITIPLDDAAISTSGDYERYFIDDSGERIHHIIDPGTGRSTDRLASVSIIGPRAFDTDALSTSVFVLGAQKGLALIERLEGFDAVVITRQGQVHYSEGLQPPP